VLYIISSFIYYVVYFRPVGIPVVPTYDGEDAKLKRKVQRITSPEKWEIKQVTSYFL